MSSRPDPADIEPPRSWPDARAVAARLCGPPPRSGDPFAAFWSQTSRDLVAAVVLAATYSERPVADAIAGWLQTRDARVDRVAPILSRVADDGTQPLQQRRDAQRAIAGLHLSLDAVAAAAVVASARDRLATTDPNGGRA